MISRLLLAVLLLPLTACGSFLVSKAIQEVTVVTPGANNASCIITIEGMRYRAYPPETLTITKSDEAMSVDCKAPGNRRRQVLIEPSSLRNGKPAGDSKLQSVLADMTDNIAFSYPDRIEVNFTGMEQVPFSMPVHNDPNIRQPEDYDLEEFRPGLPRLNSDRRAVQIEGFKRREPFMPSVDPVQLQETPSSDTGLLEAPSPEPMPARSSLPSSSDKGDLINVIQSVGDDLNPSADP